mmetsp:Transcript_699/g.1626  ORF Transcript_699/g.1626 Transcript_699/m.1626 type:complete len:96 (-) Transcript_699:318-605(-)
MYKESAKNTYPRHKTFSGPHGFVRIRLLKSLIVAILFYYPKMDSKKGICKMRPPYPRIPPLLLLLLLLIVSLLPSLEIWFETQEGAEKQFRKSTE